MIRYMILTALFGIGAVCCADEADVPSPATEAAATVKTPPPELPEARYQLTDASHGGKLVRMWALSLGRGGTPLHYRTGPGDAPAQLSAVAEGKLQCAVLRLTDAQLAALPENVEVVPLARAAGAVLVNWQNPLTSITSEQARRAVSGAETDWKKLNGEPYSLHRIVLKDSAPGAPELRRALLGDQPVAAQNFAVDTPGELEIVVAGNPNTIGLGWYRPDTAQQVRALAIDGVEASEAHLTDGTYPLGFTLVAAIPKDGTESGFWREAAGQFAAGLAQPEAGEFLAAEGLLPLVAVAVEGADAGAKPDTPEP